jgi:hypothetical protein
MATPTGTGPRTPRTPPGWPGDDPTVPDELGTLGARVPRRHRPDRHHEHPPDLAPGGAGGHEADPTGPDDLGGSAGLLVERGVAPRRARRRRPRPAGPPPEPDTESDLEVAAPNLGADLVAGVQPAGRVLVVMVAALVLAMLVNADVLVDRAERQPLGPGRDRALAVWHPVQDVSHVLQLYRIRQLADWAAGNDDDHRGGSIVPEVGTATPPTTGEAAGATTTAPAGPPTTDLSLRSPTAADPLRVWVGGDSQAQTFGQSLVEQATATGVMAPQLHYEISSGLARPDFYDWPGALKEDVAAHDPEVMVVFLGANDGQGLVLPDGTAVQHVSDPRWTMEYQRRVGAVMDQLRADHRLVVWVGEPPMRNADFDARMKIVNQAYAAEAATRPWVVLVDSTLVLGDPSGAYADLVNDAAGTPVEVRSGDGIHLSRAGADRLAAQVLGVVQSRTGGTGR